MHLAPARCNQLEESPGDPTGWRRRRRGRHGGRGRLRCGCGRYSNARGWTGGGSGAYAGPPMALAPTDFEGGRPRASQPGLNHGLGCSFHHNTDHSVDCWLPLDEASSAAPYPYLCCPATLRVERAYSQLLERVPVLGSWYTSSYLEAGVIIFLKQVERGKGGTAGNFGSLQVTKTWREGLRQASVGVPRDVLAADGRVVYAAKLISVSSVVCCLAFRHQPLWRRGIEPELALRSLSA